MKLRNTPYSNYSLMEDIREIHILIPIAIYDIFQANYLTVKYDIYVIFRLRIKHKCK